MPSIRNLPDLLAVVAQEREASKALATIAQAALDLTYSRHAFRGAAPAKGRFVLSYAINYLIGLGFLALFSALVTSPYLAGLLAIVATSLVNYFALSRFVFTRRAD